MSDLTKAVLTIISIWIVVILILLGVMQVIRYAQCNDFSSMNPNRETRYSVFNGCMYD